MKCKNMYPNNLTGFYEETNSCIIPTGDLGPYWLYTASEHADIKNQYDCSKTTNRITHLKVAVELYNMCSKVWPG